MNIKRNLILPVLFCLLIFLPLTPIAAQENSPQPGVTTTPDGLSETEIEQRAARDAELKPLSEAVREPVIKSQAAPGSPLFIGVDDNTVPAYRVDTLTNGFTQAFLGFEVWGSAYDSENDRIFFNNGSTLYVWPVGGAVSTLGTITDATGAAQSLVGLAFYNGVLYGTKNIANEAVYTIDINTLVATVFIDYVDADFDFGGFAADPDTGNLYATNDDTTPNGSGLFQINLDGSATLIAPYPDSQTDIDGLAVGGGRAYLVTDEPGFIYVYDFAAAAYMTPLNNPWTTSEVFSAGAWIGGAAAAIPALAPPGILLLVLALVGIGLWSLRRREKPSTS